MTCGPQLQDSILPLQTVVWFRWQWMKWADSFPAPLWKAQCSMYTCCRTLALWIWYTQTKNRYYTERSQFSIHSHTNTLTHTHTPWSPHPQPNIAERQKIKEGTWWVKSVGMLEGGNVGNVENRSVRKTHVSCEVNTKRLAAHMNSEVFWLTVAVTGIVQWSKISVWTLLKESEISSK